MAEPMYHTIANELRALIESGELAPGAQLPTELELRDKYEASRNTVRDAIKRLTSLNLVETRPGQGTFVVQRTDPFVTTLTGTPQTSDSAAYLSEVNSKRRRPKMTMPRVEVQVPLPEISRRLRRPPNAQVISRHQERYIDDVPWSMQTSYYPMEFITKAPRLLTAEDIAEGVVPYLEDQLGMKQVGYRDWITARPPDSNEQYFFSISHDATMFVMFRTGFDETGTPIRVTVTVFPADRNQFIVNVGTVPDPRYETE
jgi:GntR family transcriptional regulator